MTIRSILLLMLSLCADLTTIVVLSFVAGQGVLALGLGPVWAGLTILTTIYLLTCLLWVVVPSSQRSSYGIVELIQALRESRQQQAKPDEDDPNQLLSGARKSRRGIGFSHTPTSIPVAPPVTAPAAAEDQPQ